MIVLKIILWIILIVLALILLGILFTVALLSVKITVKFDYGDEKAFKIKYGFIPFAIYPDMFLPEKIEKYKYRLERIQSSRLFQRLKNFMAKRAEKKRVKQEKKAVKKPPKEKMTYEQLWARIKTVSKNIYGKTKNIFTRLGFDGIIGIVQYTGRATTGMVGKLLKHIVIKEMYIGLTVAGDDAADTAMKYGETCAAVFPAIGLICTNMKVRKYDVDVTPDFLARHNEGELHGAIAFRPILLINVLVCYFMKIICKIVFKLLFSKNKKSNENIRNEETTKNNLGGA